MTYDVVIPCAEKDYTKIKFCVNSLSKLDPKPENIYIVSAHKLNIPNTTWINEADAIPISPDDIQYRRKNWIYQQILKLCQDFTENDWYLCIDSDIVVNRPLKIFNNNKPNYFISNHKQNHKPYFDFMQKVFGLKKVVDFSFISDLTLFNKKIRSEFLFDINKLVEDCNKHLSEDCLIGEPEIYGNYIAKYYPDSYNLVDIKVSMYGRFVPDYYTSADIENIINQEKNKDIDLISMHSWT